jgi:hypothetical protein
VLNRLLGSGWRIHGPTCPGDLDRDADWRPADRSRIVSALADFLGSFIRLTSSG